MAVQFTGPALPFLKETGGSFLSKGELDLIWSSIFVILFTSRGSRVMFADFGASLNDLLFEKADDFTRSEIERIVKEDLEQFEKRIAVDDVSTLVRDDNELILTITIRILGQRNTDTRSFSATPNRSIRLLNMGN